MCVATGVGSQGARALSLIWDSISFTQEPLDTVGTSLSAHKKHLPALVFLLQQEVD